MISLQKFLRWWLLPFVAGVLFVPMSALAGGSASYEIGLRGGTDSGRVDENYTAAEVYVLRELPWKADLTDKLQLKTRLDGGVFYLEAASDGGVMLSAGFDLVVSILDQLEFEAGFRPTYMLVKQYGADDFGGGIQFTSHVGVAATQNNIVLNYRFQHTSNAGLCDVNPGLNLHMLGVGYRF